jgi:hypothetical protein
LLSAVSPSLAADAPAQLWGKTINTSYTASTPIMGKKGIKLASRAVVRLIYISSKGRIFERYTAQGRNGAVVGEHTPGASKWHFMGGKLVATYLAISGAERDEISFDTSFQSCTFFRIAGHESGDIRRWKGLNGKQYEAVGPSTTSGERCSITTGNGL